MIGYLLTFLAGAVCGAYSLIVYLNLKHGDLHHEG